MKIRTLALLSLGALSLFGLSNCTNFWSGSRYYHEHGHYHNTDDIEHHHGSSRYGHPPVPKPGD